MEMRYSAEEVAYIVMNGGDESSASSDSITSTTASEVEIEEPDYSSSSFILSRVSLRVFGDGKLPSFQDEMLRLGGIDTTSADLETCSEISNSSGTTAMSDSSLVMSNSETTLLLEQSVASPLLPCKFMLFFANI